MLLWRPGSQQWIRTCLDFVLLVTKRSRGRKWKWKILFCGRWTRRLGCVQGFLCLNQAWLILNRRNHHYYFVIELLQSEPLSFMLSFEIPITRAILFRRNCKDNNSILSIWVFWIHQKFDNRGQGKVNSSLSSCKWHKYHQDNRLVHYSNA